MGAPFVAVGMVRALQGLSVGLKRGAHVVQHVPDQERPSDEACAPGRRVRGTPVARSLLQDVKAEQAKADSVNGFWK